MIIQIEFRLDLSLCARWMQRTPWCVRIFCRIIYWQEVVMSLIVKGLAFNELFYWFWLFVSRAGHVHDCLPGAVGASKI
jgi:hypothetical protein